MSFDNKKAGIFIEYQQFFLVYNVQRQHQHCLRTDSAPSINFDDSHTVINYITRTHFNGKIYPSAFYPFYLHRKTPLFSVDILMQNAPLSFNNIYISFIIPSIYVCVKLFVTILQLHTSSSHNRRMGYSTAK